MKVFFDDRGDFRPGWIPVAVFAGACAVMLTIMFSMPVFKPQHSSEVEKTKYLEDGHASK